jgi:XTP/dITP diphosphohydrolase
MKIAIFTNNPKKCAEISEIFSQLNVDVVPYTELLGRSIDVVEDGTTFEENALKKVQAMPEEPGVIYLGDDSGIEVVALDNGPGIFSARYAGEGATCEQMCQKMLSDMTGKFDRRARFVCAISLRFPGERYTTVQGKVEGTLVDSMTGENGFGYDPIFQPSGFDRTFAQMSPEEKHELSHRGQALRLACEALSEYLLAESSENG